MLKNEVSRELNSLTFKELTELEEKIKKLKVVNEFIPMAVENYKATRCLDCS